MSLYETSSYVDIASIAVKYLFQIFGICIPILAKNVLEQQLKF